MSFSESAWQAAGPWFAAILDHGFLRALRDGSLEEETFAGYLIDDVQYLNGYARVLTTIASRAPDAEGIELFAASAVGAISAERRTHASFLKPLGVDIDSGALAEPSPTCQAYVGALHAAASGPVEVAIASVLPCFRIYAEVGKALMTSSPDEDHPYRAWIDAYSSPEFDEAVSAVETYADRLAQRCARARIDEMIDAYLRASRFEWMFWDAAWRRQAWPTATR